MKRIIFNDTNAGCRTINYNIKNDLKTTIDDSDNNNLILFFEKCNNEKITNFLRLKEDYANFFVTFKRLNDMLLYLDYNNNTQFIMHFGMFTERKDNADLSFNTQGKREMYDKLKDYDIELNYDFYPFRPIIEYTNDCKIKINQMFHFIKDKLGQSFEEYKLILYDFLRTENFYYVFAFSYLYNFDAADITEFVKLLRDNQIPKYLLTRFDENPLRNASDMTFFNKKTLLNIISQNIESYLIDIAINMTKHRADQKITFVDDNHRCYYCGNNFGMFHCPKGKYLHKNPDNICPNCPQEGNILTIKKGCIHDFVMLPYDKTVECKCENKTIEYIDPELFKPKSGKHYINREQLPYQETCHKCNIPRDKISIDENASGLKEWIKQFGRISRNWYTQTQIILVFVLPGIFINPNNKLSIFTDFAEYINLTIASNTFFLVWNIITLVITALLSFYYIAREYKENEFSGIKFTDKDFQINHHMKLKYKCANTILCCAPDKYSKKYREIASRIHEVKISARNAMTVEAKNKIKELLLKKKELNKDKLISRVLTFLAVLSLPTLVYIIYVMIDEKVFTFVGFLFIVGKIRAAWKVIKIIDILSRVNTCCSWENEKTLKEKDDDKIITNTTEPQFE